MFNIVLIFTLFVQLRGFVGNLKETIKQLFLMFNIVLIFYTIRAAWRDLQEIRTY